MIPRTGIQGAYKEIEEAKKNKLNSKTSKGNKGNQRWFDDDEDMY